MKIYLVFIYLFSFINLQAQTGINWSVPQIIAPNTFGNQHPRVVTDGLGNPLIIWGDLNTNSCQFSKWNGSSFTLPIRLNPVSLPVFTADWAGPDIASKGDTVYVVYKQTPEDTNHIYLTSSFNAGLSWNPPVQVDFIADSASRFPAITIDNSRNPIIAFMKFNLGFSNARWVMTRSNDYGQTFTNDILASGWSGGTVCDCCPGSIISTDNNVAVLYRDNLNNLRDIYAGLSNDGGNSMQSGFAVDQNNWMIMACPSSGPDGVIIGDSLYSVFMSGGNGNIRVYSSKTSLTNPANVIQANLTSVISGLSTQNFPRIANRDTLVATIWKQHVNGSDQLALRLAPNIYNGFLPGFDTVDVANITNTDIAIFGNTLHVVWQDNAAGNVQYRKGTYIPVATTLSEIHTEVKADVFPNPASDIVSIRANQNLERVSLFDLSGRCVMDNSYRGMTAEINLARIRNGDYIIKVDFINQNSYQEILTIID